MPSVVPQLSVIGFISDSESKLLAQYELFLASDKSQSNIFKEEVGSLKYLVHHYKNGDKLKNAIIATLQLMYSKHFPTTTINVDVIEKSDVVEIYINITIVDEFGKSYSLDRSVETINNVITNFDIKEDELNDK